MTTYYLAFSVAVNHAKRVVRGRPRRSGAPPVRLLSLEGGGGGEWSVSPVAAGLVLVIGPGDSKPVRGRCPQWRESESRDLAKVIPKIVRTLEAEAGAIAALVEERRRQGEIKH